MQQMRYQRLCRLCLWSSRSRCSLCPFTSLRSLSLSSCLLSSFLRSCRSSLHCGGIPASSPALQHGALQACCAAALRSLPMVHHHIAAEFCEALTASRLHDVTKTRMM